MSTIKAAGALFGFGLLVLAVGVFIGPMSQSAVSDAQTSEIVSDGETVQPHQNIEMAVTENGSALDVTLTDTREADRATVTVAEGENSTVDLAGGTIDVEYDMRFGNGEHVVVLTFPPTFSYDDGTAAFYDNLDFLLVLIGFLFAIGGLIWSVRLA